MLTLHRLSVPADLSVCILWRRTSPFSRVAIILFTPSSITLLFIQLLYMDEKSWDLERDEDESIILPSDGN